MQFNLGMAAERSTECQIDVSLFPKHYLKSYEVFLSKSTQQQGVLKWVREKLTDILKRVETNPTGPITPFKVLGVGCGDGSSGDLLILEVLANHVSSRASPIRPVFYNKAIEPRSNALSVFRASTQAWKKENKEMEVSFEWFSGTWQEYQTETKQDPEKFNLIHFGQCMYYLNAAETLRDCIKNRLVENGFILCMIAGEDDPLNHYYKAFHFQYLSAEKLVDIAAKNGWNHELYHIDISVDVTEMVDPSSVEGNLLLDFLTQTVSFREVKDKDKVAEVMQFWLDSSVVCSDGRRIVYGKMGAVVIFNN